MEFATYMSGDIRDFYFIRPTQKTTDNIQFTNLYRTKTNIPHSLHFYLILEITAVRPIVHIYNLPLLLPQDYNIKCHNPLITEDLIDF